MIRTRHPCGSRDPSALLHERRRSTRLIAKSSALATLVLCSTVAFAADIATQAVLTLEGAKGVAASAIAYAKSRQAPGGAIAIVDTAGTVIYLERLDDTFPNASEVAIGKARTAALFRRPTRVFEDAVNKGRYAMLSVPAVAPLTALQGGVPIEVGGKVVGAIGVSGAASAAQDEEIALAGAEAIGVKTTFVAPAKESTANTSAAPEKQSSSEVLVTPAQADAHPDSERSLLSQG